MEEDLIAKLSEFRTKRELTRELNATLESIKEKEVDKIVVTDKGVPQVVLLSVEDYITLVNSKNSK